jgi:hypothetical protein
MIESIHFALMTAGRGVLITAATMITSVVFWHFFSSLRFQAEMGLLIAVWMTVSAISALLVIPSMIYLFQPRFLVGREQQMVQAECSLFDIDASDQTMIVETMEEEPLRSAHNA